MGQLDVRAAIADYLKASVLPGNVVAIWKEVPALFTDAQWGQTVEPGWAASIAVHIESWTEKRLSLPSLGSTAGGPVGLKQRDYTVSIILQQSYLIPIYPFPTGEDQDAYSDMIDVLMDAVVDLIRADPTLGTGGTPIFEAGQDDNGISTQLDLPQQDDAGNRIYAWNRITFAVTEMINA